jgi:hypothetical protein
MFGKSRRGTGRKPDPALSQLDAHMLRDIGLNPDDFSDAFEGRRTSLLFTPFRNPRQR